MCEVHARVTTLWGQHPLTLENSRDPRWTRHSPGSHAQPVSSSGRAECCASVLRVTGKDSTGHHERDQRPVTSSHPREDRGWNGGVADFRRSPDGCGILAPGRSVEAIDLAGRAPAWEGLWLTGHRGHIYM